MITTCKHYIMGGKERIWDIDREELLERIANCQKLNDEYQKSFHRFLLLLQLSIQNYLCVITFSDVHLHHFRTKEILKQNPKERQFEFSENYIFGKFDTFCKRLEKISDLVSTLKALSGLKDVKIEGIDSLYLK